MAPSTMVLIPKLFGGWPRPNPITGCQRLRSAHGRLLVGSARLGLALSQLQIRYSFAATGTVFQRGLLNCSSRSLPECTPAASAGKLHRSLNIESRFFIHI